MSSQQLHKYLTEIGKDGSADEFRTILLRFQHDPAAIESLERGIQQSRNREDGGSYCERASSGWNELQRKEKVLKDFYLGQGSFKKEAHGTNPLKEIKEQLKLLTEKVARLEDKPHPKPKRKTFKPGG